MGGGNPRDTKAVSQMEPEHDLSKDTWWFVQEYDDDALLEAARYMAVAIQEGHDWDFTRLSQTMLELAEFHTTHRRPPDSSMRHEIYV